MLWPYDDEEKEMGGGIKEGLEGASELRQVINFVCIQHMESLAAGKILLIWWYFQNKSFCEGKNGWEFVSSRK